MLSTVFLVSGVNYCLQLEYLYGLYLDFSLFKVPM